MNIEEARKLFSEEVYVGDLSPRDQAFMEKLFHAGRILSSAVKGPELVDESTARDIVNQWNALPGVSKCQTLTIARRHKLNVRLKESGWLESFKECQSHFPLKCTEGGRWKPDFDWLIRPATVYAIVEGKYDWTPLEANGKPASNPYAHLRKDNATTTEGQKTTKKKPTAVFKRKARRPPQRKN